MTFFVFNYILYVLKNIYKRREFLYENFQKAYFNIDMTIELITPIAIEKGLRFAIREGGRTVGAGVVDKIIA